MKKLIFLVICSITVLGVFQEVASAAADTNVAQFNFNIIGARKTLPDEWKPANEQDELGGNIDIKGAGWPVSLDFWYLYGTKKDTANTILTSGNVSTVYNNLQTESTTEEASVGIKKIWTDESLFSFFIGGGAAWIKGSVKYSNVAINSKFDEAKVGWYGTAGVSYPILKLINIGIFGRYSDAKVSLGNRDLNAGGWHYGFLVGLHF